MLKKKKIALLSILTLPILIISYPVLGYSASTEIDEWKISAKEGTTVIDNYEFTSDPDGATYTTEPGVNQTSHLVEVKVDADDATSCVDAEDKTRIKITGDTSWGESLTLEDSTADYCYNTTEGPSNQYDIGYSVTFAYDPALSEGEYVDYSLNYQIYE